MTDLWDAIIVGAGPAGSISALLLARRGWRVMLVEKSKWPREKVCGGCLNARAAAELRAMGLSEVLRGGEPLNRFALRVGNKKLDLRLTPGVGISRATFDARLVDAATAAGVRFLPQSLAKLLSASHPEWRELLIRDQTVRARIVLACDGIAGAFLDNEPWAKWHIARNAWFGVAGMTEQNIVERGIISMRVACGGYVGAVRIPEGGIHLAAALDPAACRRAGGPLPLMEKILDRPLHGVKLAGTGMLTRRRAVGGHRLLAVGDACGYVEPFTGEGIAWAISGAREAASMLPASAEAWRPDIPRQWNSHHTATVQTTWCRALRQLMRFPAVAKAGISLAAILPAVAQAIAGRIGAPAVEGAAS